MRKREERWKECFREEGDEERVSETERMWKDKTDAVQLSIKCLKACDAREEKRREETWMLFA